MTYIERTKNSILGGMQSYRQKKDKKQGKQKRIYIKTISKKAININAMRII